jgi:hypothetical protein
MEISLNESAPQRLNPFLADLSQAMRSTAEAAKIESVERCRAEAKAYLDEIQARKADDIGSFRSASEADCASIRERSKAQVDRVRIETEERIARRRELLAQGLAEYTSAVDLEVKRVDERVAAFKEELTRFFEQLLQGGEADPTVFANMASRMPGLPEFDIERDTIGESISSGANGRSAAQFAPQALAPAPAAQASAPAAQASAPAAEANAPAAAPAPAPTPAPAASSAANRQPLLPGTLSGAGAVRGRLYSEWYGEVERLRAIGDETGAVQLLLDIVAGTEAESRAEGSPVAPRAYEELAVIYRSRDDASAEFAILERFARQERFAPQSRGSGDIAGKLMERFNTLKKQGKR